MVSPGPGPTSNTSSLRSAMEMSQGWSSGSSTRAHVQAGQNGLERVHDRPLGARALPLVEIAV